MYADRPPLKPLIWAGRICAWLSIFMGLVGVGLWTGVAGQVVDHITGEDHSTSLGRVFVFGWLWGIVVGFFTVRAGKRRDII